MINRLRIAGGEYPELLSVAVAAVVGLTVQHPLKYLDRHDAIDVMLTVLVFATALTIETGGMTTISNEKGRLALALLCGVVVLPVASWAVSYILPAGSLRDGLMVIGLAPCEIASVATTKMARGHAATAAALLVGSTLLTVLISGQIVRLEARHASISSAAIVLNLLLVVALPFAFGILLNRLLKPGKEIERTAETTAIAAVAALVALIAAQVHLAASYMGVTAACLTFLVLSALLGHLLGRRSDRDVATAMLLTSSMRDFAIAAGIASDAFGPSSSAPSGVYGIIVLLWGTAAAGKLRKFSLPRP